MKPSAPFDCGDDEFARAGLTMAESRLAAAPRVAKSPAALECKVVEVVESGLWAELSGAVLTLGEVIAFHIDERFLAAGRFDAARAHPLARCGYQDYAAVEKVFAMARPKGAADGVPAGPAVFRQAARRSRSTLAVRRLRRTGAMKIKSGTLSRRWVVG